MSFKTSCLPYLRDLILRLSKGGARIPERKYYAEYSTDKIVRERYFPNFDRPGVMVEVGGGTPDFLSMSKHFKDSGWRTIIIEPNPLFAQKHREMGNEVCEYACSSEDRTGVPFTVVSQKVEAYGGMVTDHAFSSLELKPSYAALLPATANRKTITVDVRRLDGILADLSIAKVDLLSIDVEGWEIEVLKGFDTNRISCSVIVIENLNHEPSYAEYMGGIGYSLDKIIEYNYVFTKDPNR